MSRQPVDGKPKPRSASSGNASRSWSGDDNLCCQGRNQQIAISDRLGAEDAWVLDFTSISLKTSP